MLELPGGRQGGAVAAIAEEFVIVFEPVTHAAQFIDVQGEPTKERQQLVAGLRQDGDADGWNQDDATGTVAAVARQSGRCAGAAVGLHRRRRDASLIGKRKPFLTAKRMLSNQTFRDVFKADNLNIDQRLKITSLTFLFTDLKGSTALTSGSAISPPSIWCARISTRCSRSSPRRRARW
jgi:hypothetical protein